MVVECKIRYFNGWFGAGSGKEDFFFTLSSQIALGLMGLMLTSSLALSPQSDYFLYGRILVPLAFVYPFYVVCKDFTTRCREGIFNLPNFLWIVFDLFIMITAAMGELYIRPAWGVCLFLSSSL